MGGVSMFLAVAITLSVAFAVIWFLEKQQGEQTQTHMNTNQFLQAYRKVMYGMNVTRPRVKCADGYTVSIQAGHGMYSTPREDADRYETVELGYPSKADRKLMPYAEDKSCPFGTVYAYVPVSLVDSVLEKHGGIVGADFSNDQAGRWKEDAHADQSDERAY